MQCRSLKGHCAHIVKTYTIFLLGSFNHLDRTTMLGLIDDGPHQTALLLESFSEGLTSIIRNEMSFDCRLRIVNLWSAAYHDDLLDLSHGRYPFSLTNF